MSENEKKNNPMTSAVENAAAAVNEDDLDFGALLQKYEHRQPKEGEMVKGKVVSIGRDFVTVDIGFKSESLIPIDEFKTYPGNTLTNKEGDEIDVIIEEFEDENGALVLSKEKADKQKIWDDLEGMVTEKGEIEGVITDRVKGGLSVDVKGIKAFLPGSQVDLRPVRNLDKLIGQSCKFQVIKFNRKRGNLVLSRRALLEKERAEIRAKTVSSLKEGTIVQGTVKNITNYGAFIDLGGIDGLLHITDITWGRLNHPSQALQIGDEVTVTVLKYDQEHERVSLGMKQLQPDPWSKVAEKYAINARVSGKVVSLTDYGAFVELEDGVEGLIHVSEMSWTKRVKHPSKIVNIDDVVEVVVLAIDEDNRRISLGLKQAQPNPREEIAAKYPQGTIIRGKIRNITEFGIFIGIEEGIDGLVHVSDISYIEKLKHPAEKYKKGQEVEAVVLSVDAANERIALGIKQLRQDPWETVQSKYYNGKLVVGKVTKVTDFGAFVQLEEEIEGLVHISEMSNERVEDPRKIVKEGDEVKAEVLSVDAGERRIALSMKALIVNEDKMRMAEYIGATATTEHAPASTFGDLFKDKLAAFKKDSNEPEEQK